MPPWRDMMSIALEHFIRPPRPGLDHANLDYLEVWTSCNAVDRRSQHTLGVNLSSVSRQCQQQSQTMSATVADIVNNDCRQGGNASLNSALRLPLLFKASAFSRTFPYQISCPEYYCLDGGHVAVSVLWVSWAVSAC